MKNKVFITSAVILLTGFWITAQNTNTVSAQTQNTKEQKAEPIVQSSNQDLSATIEQLKNQIKELEDQLSKLKSEVAEVKEELKLTKNLRKGLSDEEVKELQKFLSQFREIYPEGMITGYFGSLTEKAIKKFQEKYDIPATGLVGPLTREKINEFLAKEEKEEKVTICHIPLGNLAAKHTLTIGKSALEAHLAHGDAMGVCPVKQPVQPAPTPTPTTIPSSTLPPISTPLSSLTKIGPVAKIEAGSFHTCAIMADKSLYCWGRNNNGQLGDSTTQTRNTPVAVFGLGTDISAVVAGQSHTCALKTDGSVLCWGSNYYGQLGDGTFVDKMIPNSVPILGPGTTLAITAGEQHTCALKTDKSVVCWGNNSEGQVGDGTLEGRLVPTLVQGLSAGSTSFVSSGPRNSCAVKTDGSLVCWGSIYFVTYFTHPSEKITSPFLMSGFSAGTISSVAVDHFQICAVRIDGSAVCAGVGTHSGELGNGTTTASFDPVLVSGFGAGAATAISTGRQFSCALKTDSSVACWGWNASSQLGDGTATNRYVPTQVVGLTAGTITAITSGDSHSCAIKTDGSVVCWGYNGNGQLGDGTNIDKRAPVPLIMSLPTASASAATTTKVDCKTVTGNSDTIASFQQQISESRKLQQTSAVIEKVSIFQQNINCLKARGF